MSTHHGKDTNQARETKLKVFGTGNEIQHFSPECLKENELLP